MALPSAQKRELRNLLRAFRAAHGPAAVPSGAGKAMEAWVLMRLARTASVLSQWNVSLRQGDGTPLTPGAPFALPAGPSQIPGNSPHGPSFVLLERVGDPSFNLELRGSVQWKGRSEAKHELDISVIPASISRTIRMNGGGYPRGLPIVAIECKDKTNNGNLDETRQTVARLYDLALVTMPTTIGMPCRIFEDNTLTCWGRRSSRYLSFFKKGTFGIVRAGDFQSGTEALANHYSIQRLGKAYDPLPKGLSKLEMSFRETLYAVKSF
ncbi:hypothetical protein N2597_03230 [Rhizobium sophoriradicis]|uniref:hypothetical protein n=1 Tax=Rhizobium sophoriradicis TaxID=1535245 RepID=UPI00161E3512|nr:hypothetical protein N2597_03230 [Rhizobium leguminosarum bv. phaseoli]